MMNGVLFYFFRRTFFFGFLLYFLQMHLPILLILLKYLFQLIFGQSIFLSLAHHYLVPEFFASPDYSFVHFDDDRLQTDCQSEKEETDNDPPAHVLDAIIIQFQVSHHQVDHQVE